MIDHILSFQSNFILKFENPLRNTYICAFIFYWDSDSGQFSFLLVLLLQVIEFNILPLVDWVFCNPVIDSYLEINVKHLCLH